MRGKRGTYAQKKSRQGADFYGVWTNGVQTTAERVNDHILRHADGEWK